MGGIAGFGVFFAVLACAQAPPTKAREAMVREQIEARGVKEERVLDVLRRTPRHEFVPPELQVHAYEDRPLAIGYGATISQPYIVGLMTELLEPRPDSIVLEIGTGSGYQAAVLAPLVRHLYSIEVVPELAQRAAKVLARLQYKNVTVRAGDGYQGWPEHAPFDRIILTAAPPELPASLVQQLKTGGRIVAPIGGQDQELLVFEKLADGSLRRRSVIPVMFVPMVPGRN
ncbi:MAG: protein-L-isoaspartate(D-aspartate) O-methyltransferase [Bryobacterales bacterium]|nr:protein-L-isoaspartate(D-aspartate) O-methyltransferase [Bryobacterales bacterium]